MSLRRKEKPVTLRFFGKFPVKGCWLLKAGGKSVESFPQTQTTAVTILYMAARIYAGVRALEGFIHAKFGANI